MLPLANLANSGYMVLFYDQLGCGRSEVPRNLALFTVERGVEELEALRRKMKLGRVHLLGSSYGGLLALTYALKYQKNLKSLITTGGLANVPLAIDEMNRLKSKLPRRVQKTMERYEQRGKYEHHEYEKATMIFYKRHLLRLKRWPPEQVYTMAHLSKLVYFTMNGPNEFTIIGNLRYFDITHKLHKIRVPTLVTGGKYDEVTPKVAKNIHDHIKGSEMVIFERSSHMAFWEEPTRYIEKVGAFLDKHNHR